MNNFNQRELADAAAALEAAAFELFDAGRRNLAKAKLELAKKFSAASCEAKPETTVLSLSNGS